MGKSLGIPCVAVLLSMVVVSMTGCPPCYVPFYVPLSPRVDLRLRNAADTAKADGDVRLLLEVVSRESRRELYAPKNLELSVVLQTPDGKTVPLTIDGQSRINETGLSSTRSYYPLNYVNPRELRAWNKEAYRGDLELSGSMAQSVEILLPVSLFTASGRYAVRCHTGYPYKRPGWGNGIIWKLQSNAVDIEAHRSKP